MPPHRDRYEELTTKDQQRIDRANLLKEENYVNLAWFVAESKKITEKYAKLISDSLTTPE
jgi:hypothetical protein